MLRLRIVIAVLALLSFPALGALADEQTSRQRLATQFCRAATFIIDAEQLTREAIDKALLLLREAAKLDPENAENWRFLMKVAALAERDDLYQEALRQIARVDPYDDVARLRLLNTNLESCNSVEDLVKRYHKVLAPENRDLIGSALASRLALDLALLQRRHGDMEAFADALADAAATDPSNRSAAGMAAGFFRMHVEDPYAEAELLTNLIIADPTEVTSQVALAKLLLENGAYAAAEKLYDLAARNHGVVDRMPPPGLLADQALAQWAVGNRKAALETIHIRQNEIDNRLRASAFGENPELDRLELAKLHAPVEPTLATVRAAIFAQIGEKETFAAIASSMDVYQQLLEWGREEGQAADSAEIARIRVRMAWIAAWLGNDVQQIQGLLDQAAEYKPLTDLASTRFEGWIAIHRGELDRAVELLTPIAQADPPSGLGLARAQLLLGRKKDAARAYLDVARSQPGSLLGIWASNNLAEIVGARTPLTEHAREMDRLIASIPGAFFRYPESPTLAVEMTLRPPELTIAPYDPVIINIEIVNNSAFPLALDRDGPIRPQIVLLFSTPLKSLRMAEELSEIIIDLDRRLCLQPKERLVVPVDLRRYALGDVMKTIVLRGTMVQVRGILNFVVTGKGTIVPSLLGSEDKTSTIRIEGRDINNDWLEAAIDAIADPTDPEDLATIAMLCPVVAQPLAVPNQAQLERLPPEVRKAVDDQFDLQARVRDALIEAFPKLDSAGKAWVLGMMPAEFNIRPSDRRLTPIREMALNSNEPLQHLSYLLFQISSPDDPILQIASRSEHASVRNLADGYMRMMQKRRDAARQNFEPARPAAPLGQQPGTGTPPPPERR